ncbi:hypothetical protein T484DRAFT_1795854 [Baffinella frigidus]|nr:hypothetical protein T484DRAFT_1795854 [Cryptophyta sp. CCMP2293]
MARKRRWATNKCEDSCPHSPRVLPAALVPCGITPDPRNVPWALHAIGGGGQGASATKNNAAWDQRLEELRLFKEIHGGDAEVSRKNLEWPGLGVWCNRQRQFEKTGKMRLDRKVRLLQVEPIW